MRLPLALLLICAVLGGCKGKTPARKAPEPAPAAEPAPEPAPEAKGEAEPAPALEPISEQEVSDQFQAWLAAQNKGDFEAYAGCYAARMKGIKRSGPRTRNYNRAGWLKDRKRMFKKPMKVQAASTRITLTPTTAMVLFSQTWASGKYKDVGLKQLVLVKNAPDARPLIAREEMLNSEILGQQDPAEGGSTPGKLSHVVTSEGSRFLVLDHRPGGYKAVGAPRLISAGEPVVTVKDLKPASVPKAMQAIKDQPLQLYSLKGKACQARVTGLVLLARVTPHFGTRQYWEEKKEDRRAFNDQVAREGWALTEGQTGGQVLAGILSPVEGDCQGAVLARAASAPELELAAAKDAGPELRAMAMAAFRKLPAHAKLQKEFTDTLKDAGGPWDAFEGAKPRVVIMRHAGSNKSVVTVSARAGVGCGEFEAELWGAWQLEGEGKAATLKPLASPPAWQIYSPEAALDVDGDGELELLIDGGLLRIGGSGFELWKRLVIPNLDCHC